MNQFEELFDRYVDGLLNQEELHRLEVWLAEDSSHAQQFMLWSATHFDTRVALQADSLRDAVTANLDLRSGDSPSRLRVATEDNLPNQGRMFSWMRYGAVAVSASLLAILSLLVIQSRDQDVGDANVHKANFVARVIQRIDCVMQDEKWSLTNPHEFEAGQSVRLSEGLAVLEFNRGAQVTLQGPAELEIVSDNSGFLHSGKLTATVPAEAIGFEIQTPNSRVIDHGTEFGVSVDANGNSETHVFDGEVELFATESLEQINAGDSRAARKSSQQLKETMAVRVPKEAGRATELIPVRPEDFIRTATRAGELPEDLAAITKLPQRHDLVMWFEAGQGIQLDGDSRVISWQNLATVGRSSGTSNHTPASSAWQVHAESRPRWEANHFANRAAIKFGGSERNEFLATTPIQTGANATVLVVCSFGQTKGVGYGHILALGGHTRLIVERKYFDAVGTYSWVWNYNKIPRFRKEVLEAKRIIPVDTPMVCAIRYNQELNIYELFSNGQLQSSGETIGSLAAEASHVIGCDGKCKRFFFQGSIAEIAVYGEVLDDQTLLQASLTLMKKYGISVGRK